jgi:hypothetical protein
VALLDLHPGRARARGRAGARERAEPPRASCRQACQGTSGHGGDKRAGVDRPAGGEDDPTPDVCAPMEGEERRPVHPREAAGASQDGPRVRVGRAPDRLVEQRVGAVRGVRGRARHLLEHDAALGPQPGEAGTRDELGEEVERGGHVLGADEDLVERRHRGGRGVDLAPEGVDRALDAVRGVAARAPEGEVLDQVRGSGLGRALVGRPGGDGEAERRAPGPGT